MALLTAAPTLAAIVPRVTLPPTQSSGVPAPVDTTSHAHKSAPTKQLKSDRQGKAPVGVIVGVAIAIVAGLAALCFIRWLFIRRGRRRATVLAPTAREGKPPFPAPLPLPHAELGGGGTEPHYPPGAAPPPSPGHASTPSWPTPFAAPAPGGADASPAARQAHIAAELRAAQALLERGRDVDVPRTKARIRELEARQQSAWALGLE
ncbi:hypothetical protein B0H15DRAFT_1022977 [Mycena belliarum]|uniref:Uncharacterized protein n=1 Tax=Mycena belliarum TaxID=1033014 RepID=A0AAD6XTT7_9AGAR|nr:hypothetical protein B0H15DRAFT_1022977 [Mycena belliae]